MYPSRSILKTIYTDFIDTYRTNIKIEVVDLDCDFDQLKGLTDKSNRFCVLLEDGFITVHEDLEHAIKTIGWSAIGFKTKAYKTADAGYQ